jgi:hypothetical protein
VAWTHAGPEDEADVRKGVIGSLIVAALLLLVGCTTLAVPRAPTAIPTSSGAEASPSGPEPTAEEPVTLADVLFVRARLGADDTWTFEVTVQHEDTGWEHYADRWEVLTLEGEVLATRVLTHPHVNEQPFTRSQSGIVIPEGVTQVRVRAHDLVHGYGGREVVVDLTVGRGEDFEVI